MQIALFLYEKHKYWRNFFLIQIKWFWMKENLLLKMIEPNLESFNRKYSSKVFFLLFAFFCFCILSNWKKKVTTAWSRKLCFEMNDFLISIYNSKTLRKKNEILKAHFGYSDGKFNIEKIPSKVNHLRD